LIFNKHFINFIKNINFYYNMPLLLCNFDHIEKENDFDYSKDTSRFRI
jgi:hypothetical protein